MFIDAMALSGLKLGLKVGLISLNAPYASVVLDFGIRLTPDVFFSFEFDCI